MRLSHPSIRPTGRTIEIRFDGRAVPALEGETVAAALSAAGILAYRQTPTGAPRGLHCGMGACQDCVVTIDGRIGQRACVTAARAGMDVRSEPAATLTRDTGPLPPEERAPDVLVIGGGPAGLTEMCIRDSPMAAYVMRLGFGHLTKRRTVSWLNSRGY